MTLNKGTLVRNLSSSPTQAAIVAGTQELMNNPPEVELPFGNTIVRTLDGELTYTRAGETGNVNLSGVSETLLEDKIPIGKSGMPAFGAFINSIIQSENLGDAIWTKPGTATAIQDGTLSSDGINQAWKVTNSLAEPIQNVTSGLTLTGQPVLFYQEVKAGTSNSARVRWIETTGGTTVDRQANVDLTTGAIGGVATHDFIHVEKLNDGWFGVWWANATNNTGNTAVRLDVGNAEATGESSIYIYKCMVVDGSALALPYKKTTTAPSTRGYDNAYIQMMNNMPAAGLPFSIAVDSEDIPESLTTNAFLWSGDTLFYARRQVASGAIQFATGSGTATTASNFDTSDGVRFVFVYDGTNAIIYANTEQVAITSSSDPVYDLSNNLSIGSYYTFVQSANTYLKGFKVYPYALSSDAVLALGSAL